jgi:hypothetical protein
VPKLTEMTNSENIKLRILAYGWQKTKKTWWAANAAESNFNVILLDGDDGWHIVKNIDPKYHDRIFVVDCVDKTKKAVFIDFMVRLLKTGSIKWNPTSKTAATLNAEDDAILINLNKLTSKDVLIIDSWTALVWSMTVQYALENKIDLTDPDVASTDWEFYRWAGGLGTWITKQLQTLPCHIIVTAHRTDYEKRKASKRGKQGDLEYIRSQIVSTSNPHATTMGRMFSECIQFIQNSEIDYKLDFTGSQKKEGGSRNVKPGLYDWDTMQFVDVCKEAGVPIPTADNRYLDFSINPKQIIEEVPTKENTSKMKLKL